MFDEAERMINAYDPLREERERQERDAVLEVTGPSSTLEFERFRLRQIPRPEWDAYNRLIVAARNATTQEKFDAFLRFFLLDYDPRMDWFSRYPREMYMLFQIGRSPDVSNSFIE